ncbi:MAG: class I SAM-dependent methyltransferase [Pseudomonadota bacterium]
MADLRTDALYGSLRQRGSRDARSNGYISAGFFRREQSFLLSRLRLGPGDRVLDLACGSGLMLGPVAGAIDLVGVDYNQDAVAQARSNGVVVVRGDAFCLPFDARSFDAICCCQFLNQQAPEHQQVFLAEAARVLRPGGSLHLLWRNGHSLLHRGVHATFRLLRRLSGQAEFPQFFHAPRTLVAQAGSVGFSVAELKVTLPAGPAAVAVDSPLAGLVGASFYLELLRGQD